MWPIRTVALRAALAAGIVFLPAPHIGSGISWRHDTAGAQAQVDEKQAFETAKVLGTIEAWNAFLAHYPNGFYADMARAYVTSLAAKPGAPQTPGGSQEFDYPMVAGTWGGIVRAGPGQENSKVASLKEGEEVTLMAPPVSVMHDDYPWFKISFRNGQTGFMWGGILCSTGAERPDLFKLCTFTPVRGENAASAPSGKPTKRATNGGGGKPSWCRSPSNPAETAICGDADLLSLDNVLNVAYQRAKGDSPSAYVEIDREQKRWIGRRNACGPDVACLTRRYNEQIPLLESYFGN